MHPSYLYGYSNGIGETIQSFHPYQFDFLRCYPHIQYPTHQIPYMIPFQSQQQQQLQYPPMKLIPYPRNDEIKEYVPEYGWNPILVPGAEKEHIREGRIHFGFHHEIWAPQEMELENLYFQTEQNYHPLEMN